MDSMPETDRNQRTLGTMWTGVRLHFICSLAVEEKKRSTQAARGHRSVENGNHYKRDASPWQEDWHRHRKPAAALKLALTRNVLVALFPFEQGQPLATS
jgi:hypothetical protein